MSLSTLRLVKRRSVPGAVLRWVLCWAGLHRWAMFAPLGTARVCLRPGCKARKGGGDGEQK